MCSVELPSEKVVAMTDELEQRAARYLLRAEDGNMQEAERAELDAWLEDSMRNRAIYWRLEHGWRQIDRVAALNLPPTNDRRTVRRIITAVAGSGLAIAALIALVVLTFNGGLLFSSPAKPISFATQVGQRKNVKLTDGSTIHLNTDTKVIIRYDEGARSVELAHGEALFDVVHDRARPFFVTFGDRRVQDLGTQFSVRSTGNHKEVLVVEGRVDLVRIVRGRASGSVVLNEGDMAVSVGSQTLTSYGDPSAIRNKLAWNQGMIVLDQMSLGDAANEFNRYNRRKLQIDDPAIARMEIGGMFRASNVEAFARLIGDAYGLKIETSDTTIKISRP